MDDPDERASANVFVETALRFDPDQRMGIATRRSGKDQRVRPRVFAAPTAGEVLSWIPELWRYEVEVSESAFWIMQPLKADTMVRGDLPTADNEHKPQWFRALDASVDALNCIPIDLDVGRPGLPTAGDAIKIIFNAVTAGLIPAPSYVAASGRGAYAIWNLRDTEGGLPSNDPINHTRWRTILFDLVSRTRSMELEPDAQATNLARWLKMPGTVDTILVDGVETKSGKKVWYLPFLESPGAKPAVYTFDELEAILGLATVPDLPVSVAAMERIPVDWSDPRQVATRRERNDRRTGEYPHARLAQEIASLSSARGGMPEGLRHKALFYYFGALRSMYACRLSADGASAERLAREGTYALARTFNPPFPDSEVESAIKRPKGGHKQRWRASTLAAHLQVKESEAKALGLHRIAPQMVRELRDRTAREGIGDRKRAREGQIAAVRKLLLEHPRWTDQMVAEHYGGIFRQDVTYHRNKLVEEGLLERPPVRRPPKPRQEGLPGFK